MSVKNLQTVTAFVANQHGVVVAGSQCKESMRMDHQASSSLPMLPRLGFYPSATDCALGWIDSQPESTALQASLLASNAATAQAVIRAGRSAR
jgi:hypothetical protein